MTTTETTPQAAAPSLGSHTVTVLLVDDQAMIGEAVRRMLEGETDIRFHFCQDPTRAMAMAAEVAPTIILQDLVMPEIDGLTLVRFFRANEKTRDVPLIVLSTKEDPRVKAEAFALGANDYLVKLPDRIELLARIRHHSRGYINLLERNEAMRALMAELGEAAQYVRGVLTPPLPEGPIQVDWRYIPCTSLGGDAFGYHFLDDDHFAFYLLDVCGHGVGAALLSVSVMNVLRSKTLPNIDFKVPAQVLGALNETFPMDKQGGKFFTIWYGVFNKATRVLTFAAGGHPAALLRRLGGEQPAPTESLANRNVIIGFLPIMKFSQSEVTIDGPARIYLFSDGVYEISKPDKTTGSYDDLVEFMKTPPVPGTSDLDRLLEHDRTLYGNPILEDDFTILEITME
jgi:phosphoserine phosphatase RsbU/P